MNEWIIKNRMSVFITSAALIHVLALVFIRFALPAMEQKIDPSYDVLKLVDIEEYIPPPPPPEVKVTTVYNQSAASEQIIETEEQVVEINNSADIPSPEIEYLPQHKISVIPEIPTKEILGKIEYPPIALRQGIEGIVYLELFIDESGVIRKISILKDPGNGFGEAALAALEGIRCKPAIANGKPVAVRFRYPVRFSLK